MLPSSVASLSLPDIPLSALKTPQYERQSRLQSWQSHSLKQFKKPSKWEFLHVLQNYCTYSKMSCGPPLGSIFKLLIANYILQS